MSAAELKNKKPKYPETTSGTHCMGEGWTVCCPNKHLMYDRYIPTKEVENIYYKGGIYRVFVCTARCLSIIKSISKKNPELFKKLFIKGVKSNGDLILKHRDTGVVAQIAKKIDTYTETKSASKGKGKGKGKGKSFTKKQKGGRRKRMYTVKRRK
jgi:hypothetical protein